MTQRNILWTPDYGCGMEHLRLTTGDSEIIADGLIIGFDNGAPFRARYVIRCEPDWRVRTVQVSILDGGDLP